MFYHKIYADSGYFFLLYSPAEHCAMWEKGRDKERVVFALCDDHVANNIMLLMFTPETDALNKKKKTRSLLRIL